MPWQELLPVNLRMRFVTEWQTGFLSMTDLCIEYGISRKTGYKWIDRFATGGPAGLEDQSRRPEHSPTASAAELVNALVDLRVHHPTWGARKLLTLARRKRPAVAWPSRSTVCDLLKDRGLSRSRPRRHAHDRVSAPRAVITAPNDTWTTDFKGQFRTRDGVYCYPLTLRDGFSRYLLRCDALHTTSYELTRPCFQRAFAEYGLPARIRSDNGGPFASHGLGGLSRLSVWWMRLGIVPERIAPGHPEQNGSHEQFHRVLKAETTRPPAANAAAQQRRFTCFRHEYNEERPHEGLSDTVPASCYRASPRALPRALPAVEYPGHWEKRLVSSVGCISWNGRFVFLGEALSGEHVGLEEVDDGIWTIHFTTVAIGRFHERDHRVDPIARFSVGRSASRAGSAPDDRKRQ